MLARKSLLILLQNLVGAVLGYIGLYLVAQYVGKEGLGEVAFALALLSFFAFLSDLGFGQAHVKVVAEGVDLQRALGTYLSLRLMLVLLMVGAFYGSLWGWQAVTGTLFEGSTSMAVIHLVMLYYIFNALFLVPSTTFDGLQRTALTQGGFLAQHPVKVALLAAAIFGGGALAIARAYTLSALVGTVVLWVLFLRARYRVGAPDWSLLPRYTRYAAPLFLSGIFGTVILNTDKVLLGYFWDQAQVGWYFGAQRITALVLVASQAAGVLLFPQIAGLVAKHDWAAARKTVHDAERYLSLTLLPVVAVLALFSRPVIHIMLSDDFLPAATSLAFLAATVYATTLILPRMVWLRGAGRLKVSAMISAFIALANVPLNLLLVPRGAPVLMLGSIATIPLEGTTGAAFATLIATCSGLLIAYLVTSPRTLVGPPALCHARHLLAGALAGFVLLYLTGGGAAISRWYELVVVAGAFLGIYAAILWVVGELRKADIQFFLQLASPTAMVGYIRDELHLERNESRERSLAREGEE